MYNLAKWFDFDTNDVHPSFYNKLVKDIPYEFESKFNKKFNYKRFNLHLINKFKYIDNNAPNFGIGSTPFLFVLGVGDVFLSADLEWYVIDCPIAIRFGEDISDKNVVFRFAKISMFDPTILEDIGEERVLNDIKEHNNFKTNFQILSNSYNVGQECKIHVSIKKSNVKQLTKYFDNFFIDWNEQNEGEELKWLEYEDYDKEDGVAIYYIDSFRASERYFKLLIENIPPDLEIKMIEIVS